LTPEPDPIAAPDGVETSLWTCPKCGHRFVTANIWHSCSRHTLDELFGRALPSVREAFDRWVELAGHCGPIVVIPQKTRIVFMGQVRFAGAQVPAIVCWRALR
jgi:hypothetical protein